MQLEIPLKFLLVLRLRFVLCVIKAKLIKNAIIKLASLLRSGKLGANNLLREVEAILNQDIEPLNKAQEVRNLTGRHLFTWRRDSNGNISITFPKDIRDRIDRDRLEQHLIDEIEKQLTWIPH